MSMIPISDSANAPLQALSPIVNAKYQVVLPSRPSTGTLTDPEPAFTTRTPKINLQSTGHPHHSLPSPPTNYKSDHILGASIHDPSPSLSARSSPSISSKEQHEEPRQIVVSSFAPRVAVYTSADTADFVKLKGFNEGLRGLLRPFGERIQGKVVVRDSIGASRAWYDFGVRFIDPLDPQSFRKWEDNGQHTGSHEGVDPRTIASHGHDPATAIDKVINHHLGGEEFGSEHEPHERQVDSLGLDRVVPHTSTNKQPAHTIYLRKLLSSMPIVPYETFSHPVACIITISSRNPALLDTLHHLYENTIQDCNEAPAWINKDYLRYYVLMHDEDNDDITKSTALFDLMKRHFGLHCHLLRLRSSQCVATDDDSVQVPPCGWLTAEEELAQISKADPLDGAEEQALYIHESDATAIKNFLREMVTQSIVPFMESRVTTWNDQVASRRRGISGRFMSISKRLAGFGSIKATYSGSSANPSTTGSNFDVQQGYYSSETPEATMRRLADYSFMLRDWKLAHSTYELLRTDFRNDSAWLYYAAANEMFATSFLLAPPSMSSKMRTDTVDQMLEIASYSYLTRCSKPSGAIRCLTVAIELLKSRGSTGAEDAAKWGAKLLELGILTVIAQAFISERIADCYRSRPGAGLLRTGSRKRQTAFWDILAAKAWMDLGKLVRARNRLKLASMAYQRFDEEAMTLPFPSMESLWNEIERTEYPDNGDLLCGVG